MTEWLARAASTTGRGRMQRPVHGVFLLDKQYGKSSNQALQDVKRLFRAQRAGHGGTLDPLADGLLILLLGAATKFSSYALEADKGYRALLQLGVVTSTDDREGEVLSRQAVDVNEADVAAVLPRFLGEIEQIPPIHSAIKVAGKPLYNYARAAEQVAIAPRKVRIDMLQLDHLQGDLVTLTVRCTKGTYIRSLARDIGAALGCGAHLAGLTRLASGGFSLQDAHRLEQLPVTEDMAALDSFLLPVDALLQDMPAYRLQSQFLPRALNGQNLPVSELQVLTAKPGQALARVYVQQNDTPQFFGIYQIQAQAFHPMRLLSAEEFQPTRFQPRYS